MDSASGPSLDLISSKRYATNARASSQVDSRNLSPSRISGLVSRSGLLTKSHPNFPFTQVEIPFARPSQGSTFTMWQSLVQTSTLQPTQQYVQTAFVLRARSSLIPH